MKTPKPISYYGGKQRIASKIIEHIPPHTVYVEPFCGGCAVLFKKGLPPVKSSDYYREVINDKNDDLINMFRVLQRNQEFKHRLEFTLYSSSELKRAKDIIKNKPENELERAWGYFVGLHLSFSNDLRGFKRSTSSENHTITIDRKIKTIQQTINRLKKICIENTDALKIIEYWDSPQTCFYCDPPYPGTDQGNYSGYTIEDYEALINALKTCKGSIVLSCYNQGIEPKKWKRIDINAVMSAANGKKRKQSKTKRIESLWIVDRSENTREDLKKHLWNPSSGFVHRQGDLFK